LRFNAEHLLRFLNGDVANINKVEEVDPIIAALNLVMQRQASQQGWRFGRNRYFFNDNNKSRIGPRVWALMGFYSSVRPGNKLPFVNINICMSAFYEPGKLADALRAFLMGSFDAIPREFMRKVKVSTRHLGYKRVMTINRVVSSSASRQTFNCEEFGGRISIKDYFLRSASQFLGLFVPEQGLTTLVRVQHLPATRGRPTHHRRGWPRQV
jgi:hypothetical protein